MKKSLKIISLSTAMAMCVSFAQHAQAQSSAERRAEAQRACDEALEINTREALKEFRKKYRFSRTSCSSLAFNQRANGLFDRGDKNSNFSTSASIQSGDGNNGSNGGAQNSGNGGTGGNGGGNNDDVAGGNNRNDHPIIEAMRAANTSPISDATLNQLQSIINDAN
ncbi:MAG: hypothetical protein AAGF25_09295 [Pseudomonadota bacterium]